MMNNEQLQSLLMPNESALSFFSRKRQKPLYTGISPLDDSDENTMGVGGIHAGDIVEIYGNSGHGASLICYTICLNCILPLESQQQQDKQQSVVEKEASHTVLWFDLDLKFDELLLGAMLEKRLGHIVHAQVAAKRVPQTNDPVTQEEYNDMVDEMFGGTDNMINFMKHKLSRLKVIRPQNAFSFWVTVESLIQNEREKQQQQIQHSLSYGLVIVDSLTTTWYSHSFEKKDWERACDSLTKLASQNNIPIIATAREIFVKESRKKYRRDILAQNQRMRELLSDEQRIAEEMYILHRHEMMPAVWRERIHYRLIIDEDERATHGGYIAVLCAVDQHAPQKNRKVQKPTKLYKYSIRDYGVEFEDTPVLYE
jgi:RecA/RadA recombinase